MEKHPHHDVICAWAAGAQIQWWHKLQQRWVDHIGTAVYGPSWDRDTKYRVKPVLMSLGQIAYEASKSSVVDWDNLYPESRARWNTVAEAIQSAIKSGEHA